MRSLVCSICLIAAISIWTPLRGEQTWRNGIGVTMMPIEPGTFRMGNDGQIDYAALPELKKKELIGKGHGDPPRAANPLEWDETPTHEVEITRGFSMSITPVTNKQYEQFDPDHRRFRGERGFSRGDDEAVLFVSWFDAMRFCEWLTAKEGRHYRLPTEAEWEYACRAGTTTAYSTGDTLPGIYHQHQVMDRVHALDAEEVSLTVGQSPANPWGLHDMHGLVEEWCHDWYGPYTDEPQIDPLGRATGIARVTRGGSHSTGLPFLRSANRSAALPDTRSFLIGFRVVAGELPDSDPLPEGARPIWARNVTQDPAPKSNADDAPIFLNPNTYTRIAAAANGPLHITHNHCPALTVCPNGDLLAIWFSTVKERGREMVIAGARLRHGNEQWDDPDVFLHVADRNLTGSALWWDGKETLYHFNGVGAGDHWRDLALVMRTSTDNGETWSSPRIIGPRHASRHQVIDGVMKTKNGTMVLACDASWTGSGGTAVHLSYDDGASWEDPGADEPEPDFKPNGQGAWIAGIHASIVELNDGRWLAFGRGNEINGRMPQSVSDDHGKSWVYSASPFDPIAGAQRPALIRLREGPLLFLSFARGLEMTDAAGETVEGHGMFAALSFDEGKSWPVLKLVTPGGPPRILDAPCNQRWGEQFSTLDRNRAESRGYLTAAQAVDGMIHVLSSGTHYAFNLAWIKQPIAAAVQDCDTLSTHGVNDNVHH